MINRMIITENNYQTEFKDLRIDEQDLEGFTFEDCNFTSCVFENISFEDTTFTSCSFNKCSLILIKINGTTLNDVCFSKSRLMGINFAECNEFLLNIEFNESLLDNVFISDKKLQKIKITACRIKDSDFMRVDFRMADFSETDLKNVNFSNCNLEKANFISCEGYVINPETNRLKDARFSLPEAQSFLNFLNIKIV